VNAKYQRITATTIALCASTVAQAQWISFTNQTATRLPTAGGENDPTLTTACPEEKDYSWGDVDHDGDLDVLVMRKRPLSCPGGRRNLLLMNEGGVLIDHASTLANTAIGVPGSQGTSQGFLDATNDRQSVLVDVNNDGWLDIVTSTTMSDGQPRYIGYPRVYMNLGESGGVWQGFRYEYARIPTLPNKTGGVPPNLDLPYNPRFCSVSAGDITGDGYVDLFFVDYDQPENTYCGAPPEPSGSHDLDNKLLINQGAANPGYFTDETNTRLGSLALATFGAHGLIADMNGDGIKDILRINTLTSPINISIFTNPGSGSSFSSKIIYGGAPYGVSAGDLNGDGRLDIIISDDSVDRYGINTGNDGLGNPNISNFTIPGSPGEFSGQNSLSDLDNDGWLDALFPDQDLDTNYQASRRMHIFRNVAGAFSEATSPPVIPFANADAVYNVGTFDIDGDGWRDVIIGKGVNVSGSSGHNAGSTEVWMSNGKPGLVFSYPGGRPASLVPGQATTFNVQFTGTLGGVPGGPAILFYSVNGESFVSVALTPLGGDLYEATIPAQICPNSVRYYVSGTSSGSTFTDPKGAPAEFYTAPAYDSSATLLAEDFEGAAAGWSVQNDGSLTGGQWELGDPNGTWNEGFKAAPEDDASPAGTNAYVTGIGAPGGALSSHDVDGGPTHLLSPTLDLAGRNAAISYMQWFYSSTAGDVLQVSVSNNNGANWVNVVAHKPHPVVNWNGYSSEYTQTQWNAGSFVVSDYVTPTSQVIVRFTVNDVSPSGFVEGGVDDFQVTALECGVEPCPADIDGSGSVNIDDLLAVINSWGQSGVPADVNNSGTVNIDDLLTVINAWGVCQ
jgi:hypothetical protein